ncbi:MAG: histidine phosphatase family protein [Bacteroidetes bacterium]|nr:histidine phosphatase family protein [Bacteroidota bacterium]
MQEKEIYIIRHGETDMNKRNMVQGRGVNSVLNEHGHRQAKAFFEAYRHIPFEIAYSSSLTRTIQTIQPFVQLGIEHRAMTRNR